MELYKVKESDLIGDLEGFPIEVVQKMIERQYEQTGKCDVTVFQIYSTYGSDKDSGGFNWYDTEEGYDFWCDVINNELFSFFFDRYPKQAQEQEQEEDYWIKPEGIKMLVWDDYEERAEERIVIAKLSKNARFPYVCVNHKHEEQFKKGEQYHTASYKKAKPIPQIKEITMQEIADKFGLKVGEFKIV